MRLEFQQNLRLEQRLIQSPQMIQAMQILQLTTPELLERIEAELEENPFLETGEEDGAVERGPASEEEKPEAPGREESPDSGPDLDELGEIDRLLDAPGSTRGASRERERTFDPVEQLAARDEETTDGILAELRVNEVPQEEIDLAETILGSLDPRGFLEEGPAELARKEGVPLEKLCSVLEKLRFIAHPGLGARDLRENFLLQLQALPEPHPIAEALVRDHFDDLLGNRLPQIARDLHVGMGEIRSALEILRELDARPLASLEPDHTLPLLPDILVEPSPKGGYEVSLVRDHVPEVHLSRSAHEALERAKGDPRMMEFLLKKIERARWFLDAVALRRQTLLKIARALADRQRKFLDYGPERLRPLKMLEIAEAVGVHISTVSRAIRGKYAQTPQGILALKDFFSGGQRTSRGGQRSRVSIQERIKEIVASEDKSAPLSDQEIVRILRERDGVKVARRTVTKYRVALDIPASTIRRNY